MAQRAPSLTGLREAPAGAWGSQLRQRGWLPPPPHTPPAPLHTARGSDVRPENHSATRPGSSKVTLKVSWKEERGSPLRGPPLCDREDRAGEGVRCSGRGPGAADLGVACPLGSGPRGVLGLRLRTGLAAGPLTVEEARMGRERKGRGDSSPLVQAGRGPEALIPSAGHPVLTPQTTGRGSPVVAGELRGGPEPLCLCPPHGPLSVTPPVNCDCYSHLAGEERQGQRHEP